MSLEERINNVRRYLYEKNKYLLEGVEMKLVDHVVLMITDKDIKLIKYYMGFIGTNKIKNKYTD